jgi:hypothetical protein
VSADPSRSGEPTRPTRRLALALAFGLLVALAAVVLLMGVGGGRGGYEPDGPLASDRETRVTTHVRPGSVITWGTVLPTNATNHDIVIESIVPSEPVSGLTVLGLGVSDPRRGAVGTADRYPPLGITPLDAAGAVMTPRDGPSPFVQVVVGIRLDDPREGRIAGLRIRYATDGRRYETVLHDELIVVPPST